MRYLRINVYGFSRKICHLCNFAIVEALHVTYVTYGHQTDASLECKIFSLFLDKWEKAEISTCNSCLIAASSAITA